MCISAWGLSQNATTRTNCAVELRTAQRKSGRKRLTKPLKSTSAVHVGIAIGKDKRKGRLLRQPFSNNLKPKICKTINITTNLMYRVLTRTQRITELHHSLLL